MLDSDVVNRFLAGAIGVQRLRHEHGQRAFGGKETITMYGQQGADLRPAEQVAYVGQNRA